MPVDTSVSEYRIENEPQTVISTELYPENAFGIRIVPIVHRDIYGRKSRTEMVRVNGYEYVKWLKNMI